MALRVKDAMKAKIVTVPASASVEEVSTTMFRSNATCVPVVDPEGYYLGLLTESDILDWYFNQPRSSRVASDCMRADAPVVFLESRLTGLLDVFSQTNSQHATVIDDGRVVSVITIRELIRYTAKIHKIVANLSSMPKLPAATKDSNGEKQHTASDAIHSQHKLSSHHLSERKQLAQ